MIETKSIFLKEESLIGTDGTYGIVKSQLYPYNKYVREFVDKEMLVESIQSKCNESAARLAELPEEAGESGRLAAVTEWKTLMDVLKELKGM